MTGQNGQQTAISAPNRGREDHHLEVQSMRNWYLLAGLAGASTLGLVVAVTPFIREGIRAFWPWANTDLVLLAGLAGMILILILHLTLQQSKVGGLRREFRALEAQAHERDRKSASRMHALLNVTRMMGAVSDPECLFDGIADICLEIFDCQQASLMVLADQGDSLVVKAACGHQDPARVKGAQQPVGQGIAGHVARTREALILGGGAGRGSYKGFELQARHLTAAMVAPILVRDELVGVLNISSREPQTSYGEEDLQALQMFAENVGNCIRQAERSEWMRQTIERYQNQVTLGH